MKRALLALLLLCTSNAFAGTYGEGDTDREIAMGDCQIKVEADRFVVHGVVDGQEFYTKRFTEKFDAIRSEQLCEHKALFVVRGGRVVHQGMTIVGSSVKFVVRTSETVGHEILSVGSSVLGWMERHRGENPTWATWDLTPSVAR